MKKLIALTAVAVFFMLGCPYLTVKFAGSSAMAVCILLFFCINPIFSAVCGFVAGKNVKRLWMIPIVIPCLFLLGVWLFFEMGEPDFLMYYGAYLLIGIAAMLIRAFMRAKNK